MYTVHEAKTNLSKLIRKARAGDPVVIARGKEPMVKLVPVRSARKERVPGLLHGKIHVPASAFAPRRKRERGEWGIN
jgi:prevent-host-death family protein